MSSIAWSEIFSALNPCLRPSKRPVEEVAPVFGNRSSEVALLPLLSLAGVDSLPGVSSRLGTMTACAIMGDEYHCCLVSLNFPKEL